MKRILNLFTQDLILAYRNGHIWITVILLILSLLLITFLPRSFKIHNEIFLDSSNGQEMAGYLLENDFPQDLLFTDRAAFEQAMARNPLKIGIVYSGDLEAPRFEFVVRSAVAEENLNLLQASLDQAIRELRGEPAGQQVQVEYLRERTATVPFNLMPLPLILVFEVVLLGFFIAAVMVFQEKSEGILRAYRVTPGGTLAYILSKNLLFVVLGLAYGLPMVLYGFGLRTDYLALILLLVLSTSLMTMLSIAVSAFYRNLTEWFFVGVAILLINSLPMFSYALPAFAPRWLTLLPSYPAVFAVRDVLFSGAGLAQISPTLGYLLAGNVIVLIACYLAVRSQMMKGVRA